MASGGVVSAQHTAATKIRGGFSWWIEWPKTPKWICKITDKMGSYRPLPVRSRVLTPLQGLQHLRTPCITSKGPSCTLLVPGQFQVCNRNCSESLEWIAAGATVESSFFLFAFLCSRTCSFWCLFLFLFQLFLVFVVLVPIQSYFYSFLFSSRSRSCCHCCHGCCQFAAKAAWCRLGICWWVARGQCEAVLLLSIPWT